MFSSGSLGTWKKSEHLGHSESRADIKGPRNAVRMRLEVPGLGPRLMSGLVGSQGRAPAASVVVPGGQRQEAQSAIMVARCGISWGEVLGD